jgi:uncharacterized protein
MRADGFRSSPASGNRRNNRVSRLHWRVMSAPLPKPCAICGKPQAEGLAPFCSRRCADVDLNRWLSGVYAIPTAEEDEEDAPDRPRRGEDED